MPIAAPTLEQQHRLGEQLPDDSSATRAEDDTDRPALF